MSESGTATAKRTGEVTSEMQRQGQMIEELHTLIGDVELQLGGVIRNETPAPPSVAPKEVQALVPHAGMLRENNDQLSHANGRMQSLLERIEL